MLLLQAHIKNFGYLAGTDALHSEEYLIVRKLLHMNLVHTAGTH